MTEKKKKGTECPRTVGQIPRYNIHIIGIPEEVERKKRKEYLKY